MIIILVAYTLLIILLILLQRLINNYVTEGFESVKQIPNEKNNSVDDKETEENSDNKSMAQKEVEKSLKTDFVKEIKKIKKRRKKELLNIPKFGNNTPKNHKPSKDLYRAYGWEKIPPQSWSVIQKPPPKCISNTPISDKPMHKEGYPLDQLNDPINIKLVNNDDNYPKKKTGYMNMLKPVLLL